MGSRLRPLTRLALATLFVLLSLFGMPAIAYVLRPQRTRDEGAVALVAPADHVL